MPGARARDGRRADYYAILGVSKHATQAELKKAYLAKARLNHPDKNPSCIEEATAAFKRVGEAYHVLRDERLRAAYDSGGAPGDDGPGGCWYHAARSFNAGSARDLFREVFGEDVAAGFARVAEGVAPKVQAAAAPFASAFASAVDRCSRAEVLREAMAAGLGTVAADADEEVELAIRAEERCRLRWEDCRVRLQEHEDRCRAARDFGASCLDEARSRAAIALLVAASGLLVLLLLPLWARKLGATAEALWAALTLALLDFGLLLWAVGLWRGCAREIRDRDAAIRRETLQSQALRGRAHEAGRALAWAQERLAGARASAVRARQDLAEAERDGASLGGAWRVGLHLCGKLAKRVPGLASQPRHELS